MAEGRVAFLAGCAITGSLAFAVAKGWIAVGTPPSSVPGLPDGSSAAPLLDAAQLPPMPTVNMLPSPAAGNPAVAARPADPAAAAPAAAPVATGEAPAQPAGDSAIAKLEEQVRKQTEQSKETLALLREEMKQQRADLDKLRDELKGQDKTLTTMALDEKLTRLAADRGEQPNGQWGNGILWALGGMVLTVSSIVMAGVISTMARQNRGQYGAPPQSPQPFHPIRVVPTYLPRSRQQDYASARREPGGQDFVEYDY